MYYVPYVTNFGTPKKILDPPLPSCRNSATAFMYLTRHVKFETKCNEIQCIKMSTYYCLLSLSFSSNICDVKFTVHIHFKKNSILFLFAVLRLHIVQRKNKENIVN